MGAASSHYTCLERGALCTLGQWQAPAIENPVDDPGDQICYDVINGGKNGLCVIQDFHEAGYSKSDTKSGTIGIKTFIGQAVKNNGFNAGSLCTVYTTEKIPDDSEKQAMGLIAYAIGVEEERRHSFRIRELVYRFTQALNSSKNLQELLKKIRSELDSQINTGNFSIALYDEDSKTYSFPLIDEKNSKDSGDDSQWQDYKLVDYVRQLDKPVMADRQLQEKIMFHGDVGSGKNLSKIWQGVPLRVNNKVIGVIAVRSHKSESLYSRQDLDFLSNISEPISSAIEHLRAVEALKDSEKRLALAIESTGLAIWDHDFISNKVVRSDSWAKMLGYEPGHIENDVDVWRNLIHPDDRGQVNKISKQHQSGEIPIFKVEHRLKTRTGDWKWILNWGKIIERDSEGKPLRAIGAHFDITDRKEAEDKMNNAHSKLQQIFNAAAPMCVIGLDYTIIEINDTYVELFKRNRVEELGRKCYEIWFGPHCNTDQCPVQQILNGCDKYENDWETMFPHNGTKITTSVMAVPFRGLNGQIIGIVESFSDITDRKKAEEIQKQSSEMTEVLINASHDLAVLIDTEGTVIAANEAMCRFTEASANTLVGECIYDYFSALTAKFKKALVRQVIDSGIPKYLEERSDNKFYSSRIFPVLNK